MPYQVNCPSCGQPHRLTDEHVGISVECTKCGRPFVYDEPIREAKERQRQIKREAKAWEREQAAKAKAIAREKATKAQQEREAEERAAQARHAAQQRSLRNNWLRKEHAKYRTLRANPQKRLQEIGEVVMIVFGWLLIIALLIATAATTTKVVVGVVVALLLCTLAILMSVRQTRLSNQYYLEAILEELTRLREATAKQSSDHNSDNSDY